MPLRLVLPHSKTSPVHFVGSSLQGCHPQRESLPQAASQRSPVLHRLCQSQRSVPCVAQELLPGPIWIGFRRQGFSELRKGVSALAPSVGQSPGTGAIPRDGDTGVYDPYNNDKAVHPKLRILSAQAAAAGLCNQHSAGSGHSRNSRPPVESSVLEILRG